MRPRIYIASPLSNGGTLDEDQREQNVYAAMHAFVALHRAGMAPFCPTGDKSP